MYIHRHRECAREGKRARAHCTVESDNQWIITMRPNEVKVLFLQVKDGPTLAFLQSLT